MPSHVAAGRASLCHRNVSSPFFSPTRTFFLCALLASSCAANTEPDPLSLRVTWGLTGTSVLPADVSDIELVTCIGAGQEDEECTSSTCSVAALTLMREGGEVAGCRPTVGTEMYGENPVLVRTGLPTGVPIRFELRAKRAPGDASYAYVGQAGPMMLGDGERRYVDLRMYDVGRSSILSGISIRRFLHTATLLPDNRILIAGGFSEAIRLTECPAALMLPADTRCFGLRASNQALAFDIATRTLTPIRDSMLAARAGHTATLLPDGRVLIAGGAPNAMLAMIPQAIGGFSMTFYPAQLDNRPGAHASFEVFDAFLDMEADDVDHDGDLGRGRFIGRVDQDSVAGVLNQPRFLHAAAALASDPDRVLLVGGLGGARTASSWEVFDNRRPGGFGVYTASEARLGTPRTMPSAVPLGNQVWIFGGTVMARSNADLAEIWTPGTTDPNGTMAAASATTSFASDGDHPEWALLRPTVATIDEGRRALVTGWYGPQCEPGTSNPIFVGIGTPSEICAMPPTGMPRSFTLEPTGMASVTSSSLRSFGDAAELTCFRPRRTERYVALTGGFANATWGGQAAIDIFAGTVDASGAARPLGATPPSLSSQRIFHRSVGLAGFGIVTIGGITFGTGGDQIVFQDSIETVFLPSPDPDGC